MKIDPGKLGKTASPNAGEFLKEMFSPQSGAQQQDISIEMLTPWKDKEHHRQPFRPYPTEKLAELAENIAEYGILSPVLLRPYGDGYQILAGHNRVAAAKMAGLKTVPAIIRELDDDSAKLVLTDSNLYQREQLLPSEKAWAYKIRLDAIRRKAGRPAKNNSRQVGENFSVDILSENSADSARTIQRFIRLTYLTDPFLDKVDSGEIAFTVGVSLSHLDAEKQLQLFSIMERSHISKLSLSQAEELKAFASELNETLIVRILGIAKKVPASRMMTIKIPKSALPQKTPKEIFDDIEFQHRLSELIQEFIKAKKNDR